MHGGNMEVRYRWSYFLVSGVLHLLNISFLVLLIYY